MQPMQHFASDNYAGFCPESLKYFLEANGSGHEPAYGDDSWTQRVCDRIRDLFETDCEVFFVFNGTAANSLSLAATGESFHSILCHETAHVETDECGAPEFYSGGAKLVHVPGMHGKIAAADLAVARLAPIAGEMKRLMADPAEIDRLLKRGSERAGAMAAKHLREVQDIIGLLKPRSSTRLPASLSGEVIGPVS